MFPAMTFKRPLWFLMFSTLGFLLLGFICWMMGNPDFKYPSAFKDWFSTASSVFTLLGDIGLMASVASFSRGWVPTAKFGTFVLVAVLFSILCFAIMFLEYGVLNFGESDLPPYQPDTPFERVFDFFWFVVTIGAGVFWSGVILYAVVLLSRVFQRRMA